MIGIKNETKGILLSITKICETLIKQTEKQKEHWNSNLLHQEKIFHVHHLLFLVMILLG